MSKWWPDWFDESHKRMAEEGLDTVLPAVQLTDIMGPKPTPKTADTMAPFFHCCGRLAFFYAHYPINGEVLVPQLARNADGTRVDPKEPPHCPACREPIQGDDIKPACFYCENLIDSLGADGLCPHCNRRLRNAGIV